MSAAAIFPADLVVSSGTVASFPTKQMVRYLAWARAMARVVLDQIKFTRAICGLPKILPMVR